MRSTQVMHDPSGVLGAGGWGGGAEELCCVHPVETLVQRAKKKNSLQKSELE